MRVRPGKQAGSCVISEGHGSTLEGRRGIAENKAPIRRWGAIRQCRNFYERRADSAEGILGTNLWTVPGFDPLDPVFFGFSSTITIDSSVHGSSKSVAPISVARCNSALNAAVSNPPVLFLKCA